MFKKNTSLPGFTILEMMIVIFVFVSITALSASVYYNIKIKAKASYHMKMAMVTIPDAVEKFYDDLHYYPDGWGLRQLNDVAGVRTELQYKWRGPYLPPSNQIDWQGNTLGNQYIDKYGVNYFFIIETGVAGRFGRTVDGGTDFLIAFWLVEEEIARELKNKYGDKILLNRWNTDACYDTPCYMNNVVYIYKLIPETPAINQ